MIPNFFSSEKGNEKGQEWDLAIPRFQDSLRAYNNAARTFSDTIRRIQSRLSPRGKALHMLLKTQNKRFFNSRSNQSSPDPADRRKPADKPTKKRNKDRGLVTDRKKRIEALREVLPFAPEEVLEKMADSPTLDITVF